jgi:hypothetical protein
MRYTSVRFDGTSTTTVRAERCKEISRAGVGESRSILHAGAKQRKLAAIEASISTPRRPGFVRDAVVAIFQHPRRRRRTVLALHEAVARFGNDLGALEIRTKALRHSGPVLHDENKGSERVRSHWPQHPQAILNAFPQPAYEGLSQWDIRPLRTELASQQRLA